MRYRVWLAVAFALAASFVVVQATYLFVEGTQLIRPAVWDMSIATLILSGVATIGLAAHARTVREITRRIDLAERRAIIHVLDNDGADPRPLRVVR
ncbi:hypothetical protein DMP23_46675 [Amycolatopsis sp. A1MSW2902]|uniref:hypothetical protein n=1 Tax=Amycolatopsis sp. A1MSW2902 TaxID=687413 RepID=UPI00307F1EE5